MIRLTTEQAQQIEEALDKLNSVYGLHETPCVAKALSTIRAARAQEQAEQEPVGVVEGSDEWGIAGVLVAGVPIGTKLYAAPVRTKDLTDDEIMKINVDTASIVPTCDRQFHFARAVIAADREKNK